MSSKVPFKLYAPKYWAAWFGIALFKVLSYLPYSWMVKLSRFFGIAFFPLAKRRRHIIDTNISLCFPEKSKEEKDKMALEVFISSIMAIFEISLSWWGKREKIMALHKIEGIEHLNAAIAKDKGVILLVSHFTTMEIAGAFLNKNIDNLKVVYKRSNNELLEWFIQYKRLQNCCSGLIKHKSLRDIVRNIKAGNVVWYAPDQDFGVKDSVFAPFMNVMTCTLLSTQRLAKLTGAPVVPFYTSRSKDGSGYVVHFSPALKDFPSDNELDYATKVNHAIEEQIKVTPEQYLWAHRRFKTRPEGEEDVYTK